jgi:hypothetical protein
MAASYADGTPILIGDEVEFRQFIQGYHERLKGKVIGFRVIVEDIDKQTYDKLPDSLTKIKKGGSRKTHKATRRNAKKNTRKH